MTPAIFGMLVWNIIFLGLFSLTAASPAQALLTLFMIGNGFALMPVLQTRLMQVAGRSQTLAAAMNHSAFNLSNFHQISLDGDESSVSIRLAILM